MFKRMAAAGLTVAGIGAFAVGITTPAHADVDCTPDTFFILYAGAGQTPVSECTEGHDVTYDLPSRGIDLIRAGHHSGYLVRAADGRHVRFADYQERYFGPAGVVFSQVHFD
jgi:hypothetical protein